MSAPPPPPPDQPPYGPPPFGQQPPYGPPPYGQQPYPQQPFPPYGQYPGASTPGMPPPPYGYGAPPDPVPGGRRAGMGARFGGLLIDYLVVGVPAGLLSIPLGAYHQDRTTTCTTTDGITTCGHTTSINFDAWPGLISLLLGIVYSAWLVGTTGQTLGHRAAGIRVVDVDSGQLIGPWRGALRWFVMILGGLLCTVGYWSPFFDRVRRQGWHDKATRSVAIAAR